MQDELALKLAALKQHMDDYDAAKHALHISLERNEKARLFAAIDAAEASYLEVYQWLQSRGITPIWNPALKRYEA